MDRLLRKKSCDNGTAGRRGRGRGKKEEEGRGGNRRVRGGRERWGRGSYNESIWQVEHISNFVEQGMLTTGSNLGHAATN